MGPSMPEDAQVTVLMAVYNGEKYLQEAVDSILRQTHTDFEFLIVDDASIDDTPRLLAGCQEKDPRIKVLRNEKNLGLGASLNLGLKVARGRYIARMDADDISLEHRLEKQVRCFAEHAGLGAVASWARQIDERGENLGQWASPLDPEEIYYLLNFRNCLTHSTVMFRKNIVSRLGGYNENICRAQDYELWYRLSKVTKIFQVQEVLVLWRKTSENISSRAREEQDQTVMELVKKNLESLANSSLKDQEILALQFNRPNNCADITRLYSLCAAINKNLLSREAAIIEKVGLKKKLIKQKMAQRKKNLLLGHLKNQPLKTALQQFLSFKLPLKLFLVKALVGALLKRLAP